MFRLAFGSVAFMLAALAASTVVAHDDAKKLTDEQITKLLLGKWAIEEDEMGVKVKGTQNYMKEGKFEAEATIEAGKQTFKLTLSGTWKVKDGSVIETITKSSNPDAIPEGKESKDKVISIDDKTYKFKDEKDKERTVKRLKDK
jgi:hypothetical protein